MVEREAMTYRRTQWSHRTRDLARNEKVVHMTMADAQRRDAVLREIDLRSRRRASGRAGRRAATIRVAVALRLASSSPPRQGK